MSEAFLGLEILSAARSRLDTPFSHHFEPDTCQHGETTNVACMQKGLGKNGYDCSGLIVASVCDAVGITTDHWPAALRHARQMAALGHETEPAPGDVVLFAEDTGDDWKIGHAGIYVAEDRLVHASYGADRVVEDKVFGLLPVLTVPVAQLVEVAS